jgi:hypothetical protein
MVTDMRNWISEFARAMRNHRYEKTENGVWFAAQKAGFGGIFETSLDGSAWAPHKNTVTLPFLDQMLSDWFNSGSPPTGFYIAPFTNNTSPSSALKAADFAGTQGEYTGYTQATRVAWVSNGASAAQTVSNSNAPAEFTIGAAATTIRGAGLLTASAKGATTGVLVAAALFDAGNTLNPASTLKIKYSLSGAPSA